MSRIGLPLRLSKRTALVGAKFGLLILASALSFDLQLAYLSGYSLVVQRSTELANLARVSLIFMVIFLLVRFIGLVTEGHYKRLVKVVIVVVSLIFLDILLVNYFLSKARTTATESFEHLISSRMVGRISFSDSSIQELWNSESFNNLQFCLTGEAPFDHTFMFTVVGEKSSYLAVVSRKKTVTLRIIPLKANISTPRCIGDYGRGKEKRTG
jgi:hypothetical protein